MVFGDIEQRLKSLEDRVRVAEDIEAIKQLTMRFHLKIPIRLLEQSLLVSHLKLH
jgi:hypothetical protein